jgi:hypothetical protein
VADLNFGIHPIALADALYNAVELSAESGGRAGCPHVLISYQRDPEGRVGMVVVTGISRIAGGRTIILLDTTAPEDCATVAIHRDKAAQISSALRGFGRAKSTRVGVRICEDGYDTVDFDEDDEPVVTTVNLAVQKGEEEPLAELADSDPGREFDRHFDLLDGYLNTAGGPLTGPTAFSIEAMKRIINLKGLESKAVDLAETANKHVVAVSAGPHFRGVLGSLDREVYAAVNDRQDHLLG